MKMIKYIRYMSEDLVMKSMIVNNQLMLIQQRLGVHPRVSVLGSVRVTSIPKLRGQ